MRIGITGGIGTGKTTACQIFETLGIPVYYADYWAKWLMENDPGLKAEVIGILGAEAYLADGKLHREYIADRVFQSKPLLEKLNKAVHAQVEIHYQSWHSAQMQAGAPYTLKEAALIVESGGYRFLDKLIVVTAPLALRVARVCKRDGKSAAAVKARIKNQLPEKDKIALADYRIQNNEKKALIPQIMAIHKRLMQLVGKQH